MRENEEVLTHGQCRTMKVDGGSDDDSAEEAQPPEDENLEEEPIIPDKQDEAESGAKVGESEAGDSRGPVKRDFRITWRLIDELGPTPGCKACQSILEGRGSRGRVHLTACRRRFEEKMKEAGKPLEDSNERFTSDFLLFILGVVSVYAALFGTGYILYGEALGASVLWGILLLSAWSMSGIIRQRKS